MKKSTSVLLFIIITLSVKATNYYVNNNSLTGDVYCTAVGASGNNGTSPSAPKALISQVLSSYALVPGDVIFVDAGTYSDYINPGTNDNGNSTGYVKIIGAGASKTTIGCTSASNTFNFASTKYMWVEGMTINAETSGNTLTTFYLSGNADYNLIAKCVINSPTNTSGWSNGSVQNRYAIGLNSGTSANIPDFNSVISCTISAVKYGIYCKGFSATTTEMADGNEFSDNIIEISDAATSGAFEANNIFYFTKNTKILRNRIKDCFTAIYFSNNSGSTSNDNINAVIANNYITDNTDDSDYHCAIHITTTLTASSNIKIYNNSFYYQNGTYGCYHAEHSSGPLGVYVLNNLFSVPINGYSSSIFTFDSNPGSNKFAGCDYNYFDCDLIDYIAYNYNGSHRVTLANWQSIDHDAGTGNGDVNSRDDLGAPGFVSPTTGNLNLTAGSPMYAKCPAYNGLVNDIRSMARPATHAFGAYDNGTVFLPVELVSFNVFQNLYNNLLTWQTAFEVNNSHFEIEKSKDAISFDKIGIVKSKNNDGSSSRYTSYYFNDELCTAYYRLKQVDYDGSISYSKTVSIGNSNTPRRLKIYPNPSEGIFNIENIFDENEVVTIQVYDVFGKVASEKSVIADYNAIELNINELQAGWYFVSIEQSGKRFQEKILITK
jgi:hypothetical protein